MATHADLHSRNGHSPDAPRGPGGHHDDEGGHVYHGVSPWERVKSLIRVERHDVWVAVIYSVVIALLSLVIPIATQTLVNTVAFGNLLQPLVILSLVVLAGLGLSTVFTALRTYVVELIQRRIFVRVAAKVIHRLVRVRGEAFQEQHGPELVNRFLDVVTLQKNCATLIVDGLSIFMSTVIAMILLGVYHPWLLVFDILLLAFILLILFPLSSGAVETAIKESKAKYAIVAWFEEVAKNQITFKNPRGMAYALERTDDLTQTWLAYRVNHFRILMRQIVSFLTLQAIASAALLGIGGWLVIQRQLTLGQLVAAELVVTAVISGISKFGKQLELFYDLQASLDKLGYLIDLPLEPAGGEVMRQPDSPAGLELKQVAFSYGSRQGVLSEINWFVEPGSRICLTGNSGGGKTTLLNILYGLNEPEHGVVEIDGLDMRAIRRDALRSGISLVREPEIFSASVYDNATLGCQDVSLAEVQAALASVGLLEEIQALPDGLNTMLAPEGYPLSAGQAIRLRFARAILNRPRLLIADESLDTVRDARERDVLLDTLFSREAPWTLIVASAEDDVMRQCDRVYEITSGRLVLRRQRR